MSDLFIFGNNFSSDKFVSVLCCAVSGQKINSQSKWGCSAVVQCDKRLEGPVFDNM